MKKTIAVIAVILVLVAVIPFANGMIVERTVRQLVEGVNSMYADTGIGYSLEIVDYERGYLTSDIEWKINLGTMKDLYRIDGIVFLEHAKHGFAGVVSTTSFEKNPWYAAFVEEHLQGRDPIRISTTYGLSGNIESVVVMDAFSVAVEGQILDVMPARMVVTTDRELSHFSASGDWEGLSAGEAFYVGKMFMETELEILSTYIWDGVVSYDLENMNVQSKDRHFELQKLRAEYMLDVDDDRSMMYGEARFSVDSLNADNLAVDDASVRLVTKGVSVEGYEAFMEMYTQTMSGVFGQMAAFEQASQKDKAVMEQQMAAVGLQMVAAYEQLLTEGLEVQVSDLQINLPEGDITGDITLRLLQNMTFMQFAPVAVQPELLLDIFYLKSDIRLPAGLAGEDSKMLAPVYPGMQTGLFVKAGDSLVHQAETIGGKLMLNGAEVILAQ